MIIEERQRDLGNFIVGRLLPFRKKRSVGPFVFIDHMGPVEIGPGQYMNVDQHPHIGLSTLTYLLEGEIEHHDSTGASEIITPESVGFMTAGRGVTHSERTPNQLKDGNTHKMHGYQIWVALPLAQEYMAPRFDYYKKQDLPQWREGNLNITLVAGEAFERTSPLRGYSHLFMLDVYAESAAELHLNGRLRGEVAIVITQGEIEDEGQVVQTGEMLISKSNEACTIALKANTRVLIFGGEPLDYEPQMLWNFVASDKTRLQEAKTQWIDRQFPKIPGDNTYIPFPTP